MESEALKDIENYRRKTLRDLYNQVTKEQQEFFCKMYGSLDGVKDDQINWAIQQCEATIKKNKDAAREFRSQENNKGDTNA